MPVFKFFQQLFTGSPATFARQPWLDFGRRVAAHQPAWVPVTAASDGAWTAPTRRTLPTHGFLICAQQEDRRARYATASRGRQPNQHSQHTLVAQLRRQAAFLGPSQMVQALEQHLALTPKEKGLARAGMDSGALLDRVAQRLA